MVDLGSNWADQSAEVFEQWPVTVPRSVPNYQHSVVCSEWPPKLFSKKLNPSDRSAFKVKTLMYGFEKKPTQEWIHSFYFKLIMNNGLESPVFG